MVESIANSGGNNDAAINMKTNLHISGRKLANLDRVSLSDPICKVYEKKMGEWVLIGQTERISDNLNPNFKQHLTIEYYFEKKQELRFLMLDDDFNGKFDTIGEVITDMGQIMSAKMQMLQANLCLPGSTESRGGLIVRAETVKESNISARFSHRWSNLNNLTGGFIGIGKKRCGVIFEISREIPGTDDFDFVFSTPVIK